jgi:hypothetical protein
MSESHRIENQVNDELVEGNAMGVSNSDGLAIDQPIRHGSTGPRTRLGKRRASRNAINFGIFSKATLLKGESRADYKSLQHGLRKSKQPADDFEELLVDMMVSNLWRQRRALVAEGAEIRKSSLKIFDPKPLVERLSIFEPDNMIARVTEPDGFDDCMDLLAELRQGIEANGFNEKKDCSLLRTIYGDPNSPHFQCTLYDKYITRLKTAKATEDERALEGFAPPEICKEVMLTDIDAEISKIKKEYQDEEKRDSIASELRELKTLGECFPESPRLDHLLRYMNALERAFDRLLTQYERVQRLRKGQPLPPQVDVKIS